MKVIHGSTIRLSLCLSIAVVAFPCMFTKKFDRRHKTDGSRG